METNSVITVLTAITSLGAGVFLGKRRRNAETDSIYIKNAKDGMDIFRSAYEEKVKMLSDNCTQLRIEMRDLIEKGVISKIENETLRREVADLRIENGILKDKIKTLESKQT